MTITEIRNLPDSELHRLSLEKNARGSYTYEADIAYGERKRRSGLNSFATINRRSNKFTADIDYYGYPIE